MDETKKGFVLYCDLLKIVEQLPDEVAGKLFKIILLHVNDKEVCIDDLLLKIAFEPIKLQLERDLKKYGKAIDKKSESGQLGNLKRWHLDLYENVISKKMTLKDALNIAKSRTAIKEVANIAVTDTVTVTDTDTDTVTDTVTDILLKKETKEREGNLIKISPDKIPKKFTIPNAQEVQNYCDERKNSISGFSFVNFYQSKDWMIGKNKMKDWKAAVRTWEEKRKSESNGKQISSSGGTNSNQGYKPASVNTEKLVRELADDFENGNVPGQY